MRRLAVVGVLALALPPAAAAHVSVSPRTVAPGEDVVLTFAVPNEGTRGDDAVRVVIAVPPAFLLDDAGARWGWTAHKVGAGQGTAVSWRGGAIPMNQFETFSLRGTAPKERVRLVFSVLVAHTAGPTDTYRATVLVQPPPTRHDEGARTLGRVALAASIAAAAIALGGGFLALWLYLRPPPPVP